MLCSMQCFQYAFGAFIYTQCCRFAMSRTVFWMKLRATVALFNRQKDVLCSIISSSGSDKSGYNKYTASMLSASAVPELACMCR